ncbi:hypothetical protein, partial [uncultured Nostoc sp.]|uniref:hypothetical protein n=1 Tax=uncultured Nostoc sp. TaxID=340711 RepID=UPI0035CBD319
CYVPYPICFLASLSPLQLTTIAAITGRVSRRSRFPTLFILYPFKIGKCPWRNSALSTAILSLNLLGLGKLPDVESLDFLVFFGAYS